MALGLESPNVTYALPRRAFPNGQVVLQDVVALAEGVTFHSTISLLKLARCFPTFNVLSLKKCWLALVN